MRVELIATLRAEPTANSNGLTVQVYESPAEERFCVVCHDESTDVPTLREALALASEYLVTRLS